MARGDRDWGHTCGGECGDAVARVGRRPEKAQRYASMDTSAERCDDGDTVSGRQRRVSKRRMRAGAGGRCKNKETEAAGRCRKGTFSE